MGIALIAALLFLFGAPACAADQDDRIKSLEQRLSDNLVLIEALSARVAELERRLKDSASGPPAALSTPAGEQERAITALQEDVQQISRGLSQRMDSSGLQMHGFADVGAAWSSRQDPARQRGFNVGTLDLYMTPRFGDRVKLLIELAFEYAQDEGIEVDLERVQLGYIVSDALTLWAGRFHTPFGWWNNAFHHGANLQTSISRPRFVDFEDRGGLLPVHSIGLWASGKTALGPGRIVYEAYLGNGPRIERRRLLFNAFNDDNEGKMVGGLLGYEPTGALGGLVVGVHGFVTGVNAYAGDGSSLRRIDLRMGGGYFSYNEHDWEAIGEYYRFTNSDSLSHARYSSRMWFVQAGRSTGLVTPFVRYERSSPDLNDFYFASQREARPYRRIALGARYALNPSAALKLELSSTAESAALLLDESGAPSPFASARYRRVSIQYSTAF